MVLGFWDLDVPIVGAPMAGGPGTPALAAAVSNAGGLGFLAGGYISADRLANDIVAARAATTGPIGVNLFVPQPSVADMHQLDYYAEALDELAEHYDVEIGYPQFGDDDGWQQKLEVVADLRPELVSFTFGAPSPDVLRWFGARGMLLFVTVTSAYEAGVALAAGADGLVVQGPDAGGHRGTFAPDMSPGTEPLIELLRRIGRAHDVPLIAAGGLGSTGGGAPVVGGRRDRDRASALRRARHQRRAPLGPRPSAIRHDRCHPGVFGPVCPRSGERFHPDARPHSAAGLSGGQPDDLADPQGRGRVGRPARHQSVGGDGLPAGTDRAGEGHRQHARPRIGSATSGVRCAHGRAVSSWLATRSRTSSRP